MKYTYNVSMIHSKHNTGILDFRNNMDITVAAHVDLGQLGVEMTTTRLMLN